MSSRRVISVHLPITVVKILPKYDTDVVLKLFSTRTHPFTCIAVTASAFRVGCVELIAGQFQSQGQNISQRRIYLFVDGKNTEPTSPVQLKILERFFAAAEQFLHLLIGNWFLSLSYGLRRQCFPFF